MKHWKKYEWAYSCLQNLLALFYVTPLFWYLAYLRSKFNSQIAQTSFNHHCVLRFRNQIAFIALFKRKISVFLEGLDNKSETIYRILHMTHNFLIKFFLMEDNNHDVIIHYLLRSPRVFATRLIWKL